MKSSIVLFVSLLALFFAAQLSRGAEREILWPMTAVTIEDLQSTPSLELLHP